MNDAWWASSKGSPATPPKAPPKGAGEAWGSPAPMAPGKGKGKPAAPAAGKGQVWNDWTDTPVPASTPAWNAGYARRERNWQSIAWWTAGTGAWAPWWSQGHEIVVLTAGKAATCASMPGNDIDVVESDSWWLLGLVFASLAMNLAFCLGCTYYWLKHYRAPMISEVLAHAGAAFPSVGVTSLVPDGSSGTPAAVVGVTSLVPDGASGTPAAEVPRSLREDLFPTIEQYEAADNYGVGFRTMQPVIAAYMRDQFDGLYFFCPAGNRYHLRGACPVTLNDRIMHMSPCATCVVRPMAIYEGCRLQTWYANTILVTPLRDIHYYHADENCRAHGPAQLHEKTMCRMCAEVQCTQMRLCRLRILAGAPP
jgi:hypothetical protein